ncbi:late secretory pathway protein avl9 [Ascosphaera acerosa]|nr:late secretory pathway protein avl9 [Ascosphaera acerosa]
MPTSVDGYGPSVLVVGFHHARGPEIETIVNDNSLDDIDPDDVALLPFMALSDGAHLSTVDFSYFTIRTRSTAAEQATSIFGISCIRQIESSLLINRPHDVTRSTVQKAVVVLINEPRHCGLLRERLSVVTTAWFAQRDFADIEILKKFYDSLVANITGLHCQPMNERLGLSLREMIHEFKHNTLVLFKCLINNLQDCASPHFDSFAQAAKRPTSLKTSDRNSLLAFMGLPLQLFGKGSVFGPYTPLQKLDMLADYGTKSYVVGSTNSLLLQQKDRYSDILIDTINDTWDNAHPEQPKTHGYLGSEEFIRLQFEEYLLALLSSMRYHLELNGKDSSTSGSKAAATTDIEGDPALEFNRDFLESWQRTANFALYDKLTADSIPFSIVEPRHPCAGGLGMEDIQRKLAAQVSELRIGERVTEGREAIGKHVATGHRRVVSAIRNFWTDGNGNPGEPEKQQKQPQQQAAAPSTSSPLPSPLPQDKDLQRLSDAKSGSSRASSRTSRSTQTPPGWTHVSKRPSPDLRVETHQQALASQQQPPDSPRTTSYIGSWTSWAIEKRRGWQARKASSPPQSPAADSTTTSASADIAVATTAPTTSGEATAPTSNVATTSSALSPMHSNDSTSTTSPPSGGEESKVPRGRSRRKRLSSVMRRRSSQACSPPPPLTSPLDSSFEPLPPLPRQRPREAARIDAGPSEMHQSTTAATASAAPPTDQEDLRRTSMPSLNPVEPLAAHISEGSARPST